VPIALRWVQEDIFLPSNTGVGEFVAVLITWAPSIASHVGSVDRLVRGSGLLETRTDFRLHPLDEPGYLSLIEPAHPDRIQLPHGIHREELRACLYSCPDQGPHPGIGPRQQIGRRSARCPGSPCSEGAAVQQADRLTGFRVQHEHESRDHGLPEIPVAVEDRHGLGGESFPGNVAAHEERNAVHLVDRDDATLRRDDPTGGERGEG